MKMENEKTERIKLLEEVISEMRENHFRDDNESLQFIVKLLEKEMVDKAP